MSVSRESELHLRKQNAPRLHESEMDKNIHSKNNAFEASIVPTLAPYAGFY